MYNKYEKKHTNGEKKIFYYELSPTLIELAIAFLLLSIGLSKDILTIFSDS